MRFAFLPATTLLFCSILGSGFPLLAQDRRHDNNKFYDGARRGTHGGNYGGGSYYHGNDHYYDNRNQGGIGPGKGALIGGAAGAALGAVFGGGVKGSLITGAAGAGIGAIIGKSAQDNRDATIITATRRICMTNRYAVVLWVGQPDALRCYRTTGVFRTCSQLHDRSGGDMLGPRCVGIGGKD